MTNLPFATKQGLINTAISSDWLVSYLKALVGPRKLLSQCLMELPASQVWAKHMSGWLLSHIFE